jgi:cysteine/O-acetylserine efflux protein
VLHPFYREIHKWALVDKSSFHPTRNAGEQFSERHLNRVPVQSFLMSMMPATTRSIARLSNSAARRLLTKPRDHLMATDLLPTLAFVLVSTFTPGPNNIASAAMGALHGYKNALNFLLGITAGFLLVMFLCAWVSASFLAYFPAFEPALRYVGAAYILYLAFGILKASYSFEDGVARPMGFTNGFMLQLLNPKLLVYGLTLFSTFLASISHEPPQLVIALILLALASFCAISIWALFGTLIKTYLRHPRAMLALNVILALFLIYTALDLANIV